MKPSERIPKLDLFTPEILNDTYRPYDIIIARINLIVDYLDEEYEKKQQDKLNKVEEEIGQNKLFRNRLKSIGGVQ